MRSFFNAFCLFTTTLAFVVSVSSAVLPDPAYTEDIDEFKDKKNINVRMEKLLSCWLYVNDEF